MSGVALSRRARCSQQVRRLTTLGGRRRMGQTQLRVRYGPGFTSDLWTWEVRLAQAPSGRVEVAWETKTFEPSARRQHRFRSRTMPDWWLELGPVLARVHFDALPPSKNWSVVMDDVALLSVELRVDDVSSTFGVFYAPEHWPALPEGTREALQRIVSILDPTARQLHEA